MSLHDSAGGRAEVRRALTPARLVAEQEFFLPAPALSALAATVLLHVLLVVLMPSKVFTGDRNSPRPNPPMRVFLEAPEPAEPPQNFTFTNPDVSANPPDEAAYISDRDQQAAQENPAAEGDPHTPQIEGEMPEPTQNIVEGEEQYDPAEAGEWAEELQQAGAPPARAIPGFAPGEDETQTSPPVTEETLPQEEGDLAFHVPVDVQPPPPVEQYPDSREPEAVPDAPRPRPVLPQFSRGPVGTRQGAAPRTGMVAVDANFSEFGDYLARMLDVLQTQWHLLAWDSLRSSESGTLVVISFRIDAAGEVHGLDVEHSTASLTATLICQDAILSRQPYGPWTSDMQEVLGQEQTVRIRFYYR